MAVFSNINKYISCKIKPFLNRISESYSAIQRGQRIVRDSVTVQVYVGCVLLNIVFQLFLFFFYPLLSTKFIQPESFLCFEQIVNSTKVSHSFIDLQVQHLCFSSTGFVHHTMDTWCCECHVGTSEMERKKGTYEDERWRGRGMNKWTENVMATEFSEHEFTLVCPLVKKRITEYPMSRTELQYSI